MFDVQKKWTIIVSYGGATEDMKLAICFRHVYIWFTYSIDLRTCRMRIDRSTLEIAVD